MSSDVRRCHSWRQLTHVTPALDDADTTTWRPSDIDSTLGDPPPHCALIYALLRSHFLDGHFHH
ncbi:MAG TPA: hypothetical protein VF491_17570 [Vicinamibacterales bacterium]